MINLCKPNLSPWRAAFLALACWLYAAPAASRAFTVVPPAFPELVDGAAQILRVEVTGVTCRRDVVGTRKVMHTYVEARVLRVLKGEATDTITLRFFGGRVGQDVVRVPDMPELITGGRYVVFLKDNGTAFCPLLAAMHGNYALERDAAGGVEYVRRSNGERLRRVQDIGQPLTVSAAPGRAQVAAVSGGLTVDEFEASILNEVAHGAQK